MYTEIEIKEGIRQFVVEDLASRKGIAAVTDDEPLIENGVIDSLGTFRLVSFFEENFNVRISDEEVIVDNFQTITAMERLVLSHLKTQATSGMLVRKANFE
jgi:acyl carrier protein